MPQSARRLEHYLERLKIIPWGQAPGWKNEVRQYISSYYRRILAAWPEDHAFILPNNSIVLDHFLRQLSAEDREDIARMADIILNEAKRHDYYPAQTTKDLIALMLACLVLIDQGVYTEDESPAAPLLALFEAGYELNPTHQGLDVCYASGMCTIPLPARESIAELGNTA